MVTRSEAKQKALDYLSRFARTELQVVRYLKRKGFTAEEVSSTIAYLREHRFVNDEAYAESFIENRIQRGDGPIKIKQLLLQKGIDSATAQRLIEEFYPVELQLERAEVVIRKRVRSKVLSRDWRQRIFRFVASRGFPPYVIIQAFERLRG